MSPDDTTPMEQIVNRETPVLKETARELANDLNQPADLLSGICVLLNLRQRYFGQAGEHGSVVDVEGINTVDALDEVLVSEIDGLISAYLRDARPAPDPTDLAVVRKACRYAEDLPDHPTGYMVIYVIRQSFETLEPIISDIDDERKTALENAFAAFLGEITSGYVESRTTPVDRHLSDVAREYAVVARMACECGDPQFKVQSQALVEDEEGPMDRLDVSCLNCSRTRELLFPLRHLDDLNQVSPDQLGDSLRPTDEEE